jgi:hypothetical protein
MEATMGIRERLAAGAKRVKDRATNQRENEAERQVERKANAESQERERKDGSDVDHTKVSPESDEEDEMFRRAEDAATMGSPIDATIDPVTSPEGMEKLARGKGGAGEDPDDLGLFGGSDAGSESGSESEDGGLFDFGSGGSGDGLFDFGFGSDGDTDGAGDEDSMAVDDDLGLGGGDDES